MSPNTPHGRPAQGHDAFVELQRRLAGVVCGLRWQTAARRVAGLWLAVALLAAMGAFEDAGGERAAQARVSPAADTPLLVAGAFGFLWGLATAGAFSAGLVAWVWRTNRQTRRTGLLPVKPKPVRGVARAVARLWGLGDAALRDRAVQTLEAAFPELQGRLRTACEQRPETDGGRFHVLQWLLFEEICAHARTHDWASCCHAGRAFTTAVTIAVVTTGLAMAIVGHRRLACAEPPARWTLTAAASAASADAATLKATVEPGDAEVELGSNVVVTASFVEPPETRVWLVVADGERQWRRPMQRALDPSTFTASLQVGAPQHVYHIATQRWNSRRYRLTAYRRPELERIDARIEFPDYAARPPAVLSDVTRVSVPDRGRVVLTAWASAPAAVVALVPEHAGGPESAGELERISGIVRFRRVGSADLQSEKLGHASGFASGNAAPASLANDPAATMTDPAATAEATPRAASADTVTTRIAYRASWVPGRSQVYRVVLFDARGHRNRRPPRFTVTLVPNRRPRVRVVFPGRDRQVSPLEELSIEAEAHDDFGLVDFGLVYQVPGHPPRRVSLLETATSGASRPSSPESGTTTAASAAGSQPPPFASARYVVALEELRVHPDQLVCYHAYAVDRDTSGRLRETFSDMFFAEVRPFEEIFRQGQSPPSGSQQGPAGNARQAEQLAQLQKEVVNATWTLWRHSPAVDRDSAATTGESATPAAAGSPQASQAPSVRPTARAASLRSFADDVNAVREAQRGVQTRLRQLLTKLNDPQSVAYARQADGHIGAALQALSRSHAPAGTDPANGPLAEALQAEQLAYQTLLKLRAREHQVVQGQNGGGQGQSSGRSAEQLKQLELTNRENRYEAERRASPQSAQQRERLQSLSRLRELARRQQEIKDRLRELQAQLLARTNTRDEPDAVQRELRRLREAQRSVLQDLDELQQRLQSHNDPDSRTTREQLRQTREHVRRSADELQRGQVGRAIAESSRAQQQLARAHDALRRTVANRFAEDIRRLRRQSDALAERQKQIAQRMDASARTRPRLRPDGDRDQLAGLLHRQRQDTQRLLDAMADLVRRAEHSEPLLARRVYEAARQAHSDRLGETLQDAADALAARETNTARQLEQHARDALERLRAGLQDAERAVLGDELNALKLARSQLDELADAVRREWQDDDSREPTDARGQPAAHPDRRSRLPGADRTRSALPATARTPPEHNPAGTANRRAASRTPASSDTKERAQPAARDHLRRPGRSSPSRGSSRSGERSAIDTTAQRDPFQRNAGRTPASAHDEANADRTAGATKPTSRPADARANGAHEPPSANAPRVAENRSRRSASAAAPAAGKTADSGPDADSPRSPPSDRAQRQASGGTPSGPGRTPSVASASRSMTDGSSGAPRGTDAGRRGEPSERTGQARTPQRLNAGGETSVESGGPGGPILGSGFRAWSDRMRELEETVSDPALRDRLIAAREAARQLRVDWKRHGKEPSWDLVRTRVWEPLAEVARKLDEEIARRDADGRRAVPLEREPVPERFSEIVRRYFEELGSGR